MMTITSLQVAKLLGVTRRTVIRWVEYGILRPACGHSYHYSPLDVLVAGIARDMQLKGCELPQILVVVNWLRETGIAALQNQWRSGRNYILSVGAEPLFHRQFSYAEIFANPAIDLAAAHEMAVPVCIVNVEKAHRILIDKLVEIEAQERVVQ